MDQAAREGIELSSLKVFKKGKGVHLGTWFSGGLVSARLTVGLDLKGLSEPK